MAANLVPYERFVEVQHRRARIVAVFSRSRDVRALRTRPAAIHEPIDVGERPAPDVEAKTTRGVVDVR